MQIQILFYRIKSLLQKTKRKKPHCQMCSHSQINFRGTRQCPERSACLQTDINPNDGYTSFDNFGSAMLTCAQLITLDFWEDVYGKVCIAYQYFI